MYLEDECGWLLQVTKERHLPFHMLWPTGSFNSLKVANNVKVACFGAELEQDVIFRCIAGFTISISVPVLAVSELVRRVRNASTAVGYLRQANSVDEAMCVNAAADAVVSRRPIVQLPRSGSKLIYCFVQMSVYSSLATFYRSCFLKGYISSVTCIHNSSKTHS